MSWAWHWTSCSEPAVRAIATLLLTALACAFTPAAKADYYIVVGERNPVAGLTQQQVQQLFMGRTRSYPDGRPATPCDIASDALRAGFYRALSGMSLPQVTSYWARLMFSGRNLPPQRLNSEAAVIERLQNDPAAIGWLPVAPKQKGLRTVLVLKGAP
jgi:hypothetical protein